MKVDKKYCVSSFLMFRAIADHSKCFSSKYLPRYFEPSKERVHIKDSEALLCSLKNSVEKATSTRRAALALSGGIDSAILAKFMPPGSVAYTFKCVVPGRDTIDETKKAALYARECGLEHRVIEIYWDDFEESLEPLMQSKGAPIHSIEVQIYKAAKKAKYDGFDALIFGEAADCLYGGHDGLLSRDWLTCDFAVRYTYVSPEKVLKHPESIINIYEGYSNNGVVDVVEFLRNEFFRESMGSYSNPCRLAQTELIAPYSDTLPPPLDLNRIRQGEPKYLVRQVFETFYPDFNIPPKTPMPRPMDEWLAAWPGPKRDEFLPGCACNLSGDQKWLLYSLERFLDMIDD